MSRKKDFYVDQARQVYDLTQGLSREVAVNYIAATLRLASQRGAIEGQKKPEKEKLL